MRIQKFYTQHCTNIHHTKLSRPLKRGTPYHTYFCSLDFYNPYVNELYKRFPSSKQLFFQVSYSIFARLQSCYRDHRPQLIKGTSPINIQRFFHVLFPRFHTSDPSKHERLFPLPVTYLNIIIPNSHNLRSNTRHLHVPRALFPLFPHPSRQKGVAFKAVSKGLHQRYSLSLALVTPREHRPISLS